MFFEVSKLSWLVADPTNALLLLLVVAVVVRAMGFRHLATTAAVIGTLGLLIVGFGPVGNLLLQPLENRFPPLPADEAAPTGIIVLGGSTDEEVTAARGQVTISAAAGRITEAIILSRRFPNARLVFSGGSGNLVFHQRTEAEDTRNLWVAMGVASDRITLEDRSRSTFENAQFTKQLIAPKPGERWILVTSARHMPRAVGCFRQSGFSVIPDPVDYQTTNTDFDLLPRPEAWDGLRRFDAAVKEWVGLAVYNWTGRSDALFPAP